MSSTPEVLQRAHEFCQRKALILGQPLGSGVHGSVFDAEKQSGAGRSAIKIHHRQNAYGRERDVYLRLKENAIRAIRGCAVPVLLDFDDDLWAIEMTVVTRPFVLDFAGAQLDWPTDFSEEVLADWHTEKKEQFGPRWPDVLAILGFLESLGVFMEDVNPGNISFGE